MRWKQVQDELKNKHFWHGDFYTFCSWPLILSSIQSLSRVRLFATPWTTARQASLSIMNSWSLPKLTSIESVRPSNHLILCRPLLLPPSIFPNIRVFSNESVLRIRWSKYWSFSFNISSNEHPGLIPLGWTDWTSCSPRDSQEFSPNHSWKASILWHSAFFIVQLSHPCMTTRKIILDYMDLCHQSDFSAF